MAATIYSVPDGIKVPEFDWNDLPKYNKECEEFNNALAKWLIKRHNGKNVGKIIRFPVADGYAEYMVAAMKPLELVHIPLFDGYAYADVDLMTAKRVQEKIDSDEALEKLFPPRKA